MVTLRAAEEADFEEIVDLVNWAYRGRAGSAPSWNVEMGIVGGQRLDMALLREELTADPAATMLVLKDAAVAPGVLGTAWVNPEGEVGVWYVGLLTVRPDLQDRGLGRQVLAAAEDWARERGGQVMRMTVLHVRESLLAWYARRGYRVTGETKPYPKDNPRFGKPLVDALYFDVLEKVL